MGSKTSKTKRPSKSKPHTSVETDAIVLSRIPQELVDEILDHLSTDPDSSLSLRSCVLVSKSWVPSCRRHLFYTIQFTPRRIVRWFETFPVREESPAHLVRHLHLSVETYNSVPEECFDYTSWFTNVERVSMLRRVEIYQWLSLPSFWRLPESATSLTIEGDTAITLKQIRIIMLSLPNLEDLSLSGYPGSRASSESGTTLRGRFGGQLQLFYGTACSGIADMLLEVPTGLHFTEVRIRGSNECLLPAVRITEACAKTLVRLSFTISYWRKCHLFSWPSQF